MELVFVQINIIIGNISLLAYSSMYYSFMHFCINQIAYCKEYAEAEGMGSEIPIKFCLYQKSTKWVFVSQGETCPLFLHGFNTPMLASF